MHRIGARASTTRADTRRLSVGSAQSIDGIDRFRGEPYRFTITTPETEEVLPPMALINTEIKPFAATAYKNGSFVDVTDADLKGTWSVVFFYPADFTFVCPTELGDLADHYE